MPSSRPSQQKEESISMNEKAGKPQMTLPLRLVLLTLFLILSFRALTHLLVHFLYNGQTPAFLSGLIHGRQFHPVEFYYGKVDRLFGFILIGCCLLYLLVFLIARARSLFRLKFADASLFTGTLFLSLILAVVIFEVFSSVFQPSPVNQWTHASTQFDPELGWSSIPNGNASFERVKITSNSLGFRSDELDKQKKHIVILGDSVARGHNVSDDETVSHYLDEKVSPFGYQVLNLAVSGYGNDQEYLAFKRYAGRIPNLAYVFLVVCASNDLADTGSNVAYGKRKPLFRMEHGELKLSHGRIHKYGLRNLFSKSRLLTLLSQKNEAIRVFLARLAGDVVLDDAELDRVLISLWRAMHDLAEQKGAGFTLVLHPSRTDFISPSGKLIRFQSLMGKAGLDSIDYYGVLKRKAADLTRVYLDDAHNSAYGNRLLAEELFEHIRPGITAPSLEQTPRVLQDSHVA